MTAKGSTYSSVNTTKDNVVHHIRSSRVQYYKIRTIIISTTFMARVLTILIGQLNVLCNVHWSLGMASSYIIVFSFFR